MSIVAGAAGIYSDDFWDATTQTLNAEWAYGGGGTPTFEGAGTSDARIVMAITGTKDLDGFNHFDVLQDCTDNDFTITLKADTTFSETAGQEFGIWIQEATTANVIVLGFYTTGNVDHCYVATYNGTSWNYGLTDANLGAGTVTAPNLLKATYNSGAGTFDLSYDEDNTGFSTLVNGQSWAGTPARVGMYVANFDDSVSYPDFTQKFDYFLEASGPFVPGEDQAQTAGSRRIWVVS